MAEIDMNKWIDDNTASIVPEVVYKRQWLLDNSKLTGETVETVDKMTDTRICDLWMYWQDKIEEWEWDAMP